MNRRVALKNLTMSLGYVVAAPTLLKILASCTSEAKMWTPVFLSAEEKYIVTHLVDIILPSTDTPGALDVNVPQFLDMMYKDIEKESNQKLFKNGAKIFIEKFTKMFDVPVLEGKKQDFEKLFAVYFDISEDETQEILLRQKIKINKVSRDDIDSYLLYKFLLSIRYYTLFGYYTSEKIGEEVLNYDPNPGVYNGCIPLEEIGNAWSL